MARQVDMQITGTRDNVIFYKQHGEFLMRTVQTQAEASKKAAEDFGHASNKAKILRQLLLPMLPNPKDRDMQNRLTPAMLQLLSPLGGSKAVQAKTGLAGFRFVLSSDLKECLRFDIALSQQPNGDVLIEIPSITPTQSIAAPTGTSRVELELMAVAFQPNDVQTHTSGPESLSLPYNEVLQPASHVTLTMNPPAGSIIVVAASVSYWQGLRRILCEGFMPAEIVGVFL